MGAEGVVVVVEDGSDGSDEFEKEDALSAIQEESVEFGL